MKKGLSKDIQDNMHDCGYFEMDRSGPDCLVKTASLLCNIHQRPTLVYMSKFDTLHMQ